jgi:hypothetical protein
VKVYSVSTVLSSPEPSGHGQEEQKERKEHEKGHEEHACCADPSNRWTKVECLQGRRKSGLVVIRYGDCLSGPAKQVGVSTL